MNPPRLVAICGYPTSGKSTAAEFLAKKYGAQIVDDGRGLREACCAFYGLTWDDVSTQEGKKREVEINGETFTVRQLLGDFGKMMEAKHGDQVIPDRAISRLRLNQKRDTSVPFYVFGSVRMRQGITYHKHGGIVIEITRPGTRANYDFDEYDRSLVDESIHNDGSVALFHSRLSILFDEIYGGF